MRLTEQQLAYFDTFGFLKFPGLLSDEVERISEAFGETWRSVGGGHHGQPHDHERRSALIPFIDRTEYLSGLLDDPRIEGIAASLLGEDFNYSGSDGNYYVGDTKWHSDGYVGKKYLSVKMAFYLDPVTSDTGCLRVIPGSHKYGDRFGDDLQEVLVRSTDNRNEDAWGIRGSDVPAAALETVPGDLLLFNHNIKHASFGGGTARRMFTVNLEERYRDEDLGELRDVISQGARFWIESSYGEVMVRTAGPSRMVHLEQRMANDGHLAALSRKAREEMSEPSRG